MTNTTSMRAALLGALLAGCTSGATLSLSAQAESEGTPAAQSLDLGNGIVLDEVQMVVRKIELEDASLCPAPPPAPSPALATSDDGDDDCDGMDCDDDGDDMDDDECGLHYGPYAVVVAGDALVSGTISWAFDVTVPAGTYDELEIQVNTIPDGKAGGDPVLQAMAEAHASVIVTGTVDGMPFTFATPVAFTQEREPFEVPAEGANVTLEFDPSTWFVDDFGNRLDPLDPFAKTEITQNIRDSLRLLADDDMDGCDDDDHDGDGDDCDDEDDDDHGSP